jgi:hypothetical protein
MLILCHSAPNKIVKLQAILQPPVLRSILTIPTIKNHLPTKNKNLKVTSTFLGLTLLNVTTFFPFYNSGYFALK